MMNLKSYPSTVTIALTLSAHQQAEHFLKYHSNPQLAKQVYLNTLAVYAVNSYLQCQGFETDLSLGESWNPVMQTFMDVADLMVKDHGKLECRPVLLNAENLYIPAEVCSERIGYVAVQLDESLRYCTLLGFTEEARQSEIPLEQLRSIEELTDYLNQSTQALVKLNQWLDNIFELGWQTLEELLNSQSLALSFRYGDYSPSEESESSSTSIRRVKLLELPNSQSLALMVEFSPAGNEERNLSVKISPTGTQLYLPQGLEVMILDEAGIGVMQAQARNTQAIELKFSGEIGERFSIKLALDHHSISENFII